MRVRGGRSARLRPLGMAWMRCRLLRRESRWIIPLQEDASMGAVPL